MRGNATFRAFLLAAIAATGSLRVAAQLNSGETPAELQGVEIVERLNEPIPLDVEFFDDQGVRRRLGHYFKDDRPVIITLNYLGCPMLCGLQLNGLLDALKQMSWTPGEKFQVLTISFEPLERYDLNPQLVKEKKRNYINELGKSEAGLGWHFLTGDRESIKKLTAATGFYYKWNPQQEEWMHKSALILVTPDGRISRYLGGIAYDPTTLRLSLVEASNGKIGSLWDQVFLTCFHYVPADGKYVPIAMRMMRLAAAATVLLLVLTILVLWRSEVRRRRAGRAVAGAAPIAEGPPLAPAGRT